MRSSFAPTYLMNNGEVFTRVTIWFALAGYSIGIALRVLSRKNQTRMRAARLVWTFGCISLIAHVVCAFNFYHQWSHDTAYQETARQTAEVFGVDWGGGLYFNYALLIGWVIDVVWWWRGIDVYERRPKALVVLWQGFLFFIFFNATVVFAQGNLRYIGLVLCLAVCLLWWYAAASSASSTSGDDSKTLRDGVKN